MWWLNKCWSTRIGFNKVGTSKGGNWVPFHRGTTFTKAQRTNSWKLTAQWKAWQICSQDPYWPLAFLHCVSPYGQTKGQDLIHLKLVEVQLASFPGPKSSTESLPTNVTQMGLADIGLITQLPKDQSYHWNTRILFQSLRWANLHLPLSISSMSIPPSLSLFYSLLFSIMLSLSLLNLLLFSTMISISL